MRQLLACIAILILGLTVLPNAEDSSIQQFRLDGRVTDGSDPIVGATVVLMQGDRIIAGAPSGADGGYIVTGLVEYDQSVVLQISAVGFAACHINVTVGPLVHLPEIMLQEAPPEMRTVRVLGSKSDKPVSLSVERQQILRSAQQSFVPTNPLAAIKSPEVVRQGSNHSSQIRIDGAAPKFLIDGAPMGTDPDHYGILAVLPTPAVEGIELQSRGTSARHGGPSVVEIETPRAYKTPLSGELNLSVIEATGAVAYGSEDRYVLATLRKSVLDQLVNNIDIRAGRRTIPPAGFTDLFLSIGRKLGNDREIVLNQYHAADRLAYETGPSKIAPNGASTFQDTEEHFVSGRFTGLFGEMLLEMTFGIHLRDERYAASSLSEPSSLDIDLEEQMAELNGGIQATWDWQDRSIEIGIETSAIVDRNTSLSQHNWNFLPPNATSDSPHPYQPELNSYFGELEDTQSSLENAMFVSVQHDYGRLSLENGLRLQTFSGLASSSDILQRHRAVYAISDAAAVTLYAGRFSESPILRLLEPYQVLIRLDQAELEPVATDLISLGGKYRKLNGGLFARRSHRLPVLEPDFSGMARLESPQVEAFDSTYSVTTYLGSAEFLSMRPTGEAIHYGGELSLSSVQFLDPRLTIGASYAYTYTKSVTAAASYPTDLDSPHRLYTRLDFSATDNLSLGSEFSLRSGYPYTPFPSTPTDQSEDRFNSSYYSQQQSTVNSERFPVNYQLNVNLSYDFGQSQIFFNVANLTNRGNPVINTNGGFVYDAGILPSLGYRLTF